MNFVLIVVAILAAACVFAWCGYPWLAFFTLLCLPAAA